MTMTWTFWREALSDAPELSERFRSRHARILTRLASTVDSVAVQEASALARHDARAAARFLAGAREMPCSHDVDAPIEVDGESSVASAALSLLGAESCLTCALERYPVLEHTWVPIHPSRRPHAIPASSVGPLVALVWPADTLASRAIHQRAVEDITDAANAALGVDGLRIRVPNEYGFARQSSKQTWVLAPNYGLTLEDGLRQEHWDPARRSTIIHALAMLRAAMLDAGVIWQGFAPRNMFLHDNEIVLIDFEETVSIEEDPTRAAELLIWHRVFFADCLQPEEAEIVFAESPAFPQPDDGTRLNADDFERALLGVQHVRWDERRALLTKTLRLEGRHRRPSDFRDAGILHGHELGHFWGDFLPVEVETRIFQVLAEVADAEKLAACMEVFEAAMEADIDRLLQASMLAGHASCLRTEAMADTLELVGAHVLADARHAIGDWYRWVEEEPGYLVDVVAFRCADFAVPEGSRAEYLVGAASREQHAGSLQRTVEMGLDFLHGGRASEGILRYANVDGLRDTLAEPLPRVGSDIDWVLDEARRKIVDWSVAQAHPGYLAFPDSGNAVAALAGSLLAPLLNQNLIAVDRSAPSATFATVQVVEWLRELVGYSAAPIADLRGVRDVAGLWTTGGHLSNHIAMLTALGRAHPTVRQQGLHSLAVQPTVLMAGAIAHYSHSDAAFHLGLGWDAVVQVGSRSDFTTDPAAVEEALASPPEGTKPFMVVGVAGNCRTTGLDDLRALAEICRAHGVWFHVDACHGGSLIFNRRLRDRLLGGIELADSVSLDPHKGLFTPYPSSYVVFRERGALMQFSRHSGMVSQAGVWDLGLVTPFLGSSSFGALPTWMLLKHVGADRLGDLVAIRQGLVRLLERRIADLGLFVNLNDVDFYRLVFVLCPPAVKQEIDALPQQQRSSAAEVVSRFTSRLNTVLYEAGQVCFDEHTLLDLANRIGCGRDTKFTVMAACPGNPLTTLTDLEQAVRLLEEAARPLVGEMLAALHAEADPEPTRLSGPAGWHDS